MNQVLFYSIQSEPIANILNGNKTIEVRKRDLPQWAKDKLARGEKVLGYGYCTKGKPILSNYYNSIGGNYTLHSDYSEHFLGNKETQSPYILNGLVVVKFEVSGSDEIRLHKHWNSEDDYDEYLQTSKLSNDELCDKSCLSNEQLENYLTEARGYAHHLTNIQPVNMELGEFFKYGKDYGADICEFSPFDYDNDLDNCLKSFQLTKAPQSFQTVWVKGE